MSNAFMAHALRLVPHGSWLMAYVFVALAMARAPPRRPSIVSKGLENDRRLQNSNRIDFATADAQVTFPNIGQPVEHDFKMNHSAFYLVGFTFQLFKYEHHSG